jgi:colanic acid/amylovoran biosynthesis glycosyltransferase
MIQNNPDTFDELFNITDIITVLSERMKKELTEVGCSEQKIAIQPLPVDMDMFGFKPRSKTEDEKYKLLTVARFDEQKGLRYAVDAIAELTDDYDLSYTIAGDGPLFDDIQARIRDHGIEDSVELLGWLDSDQVQEVMDDAHVFLLPSVTAPDGAKEGTPTVLVEAQAAGLPVVSTYHAGIPEIVEDGESGILVPEKDIDALVTAIKNVLDAPNRWASMGKNGRERIEERHSIPAVVNDLETLYHSASRG